MSSPHSEGLEQLKAEYQRQFAELRKTQDRLKELSCTVTAPRQVVSVTVGHGGVIKDVKFHGNAYKRMAPAELAAVVLKVVGDAQRQIVEEAADVIAPTLPPGVDARGLLSGDIDLQTLIPSEPELRPETRDLMKIKD
ncbi:YbaB/EbfC family nucleoid-associated protein [Lentzea sp. NPDC004782]|uniref:YbaB/EbfC family nucleoid-associated protein n=1 Tax=Lentzea sp. NPDC004782 TaxID=3154458 RepID=UPI0033B791A6